MPFCQTNNGLSLKIIQMFLWTFSLNLVILYVFGGFGILFFGSVCLICGSNVGKSLRKPKPPDIVWDSLGSGLDIDLRSHLDPNVNEFAKAFDDEIISRAKRLQRPEETLLLLEDEEEEDL